MNQDIQIIDNFLDDNEYQILDDLMLAKTPRTENFKWSFCEQTALDGDGYCQFVHLFWWNYQSESDYQPDVLYDKLNYCELVRCKANLQLKDTKKIVPPFHVDVDEDCKTAIFYMNSNDGYTLFENGDTIESVKNRVVIFPSQYMHTGVNTTDSKYRMVINVNYFD